MSGCRDIRRLVPCPAARQPARRAPCSPEGSPSRLQAARHLLESMQRAPVMAMRRCTGEEHHGLLVRLLFHIAVAITLAARRHLRSTGRSFVRGRCFSTHHSTCYGPSYKRHWVLPERPKTCNHSRLRFFSPQSTVTSPRRSWVIFNGTCLFVCWGGSAAALGRSRLVRAAAVVYRVCFVVAGNWKYG